MEERAARKQPESKEKEMVWGVFQGPEADFSTVRCSVEVAEIKLSHGKQFDWSGARCSLAAEQQMEGCRKAWDGKLGAQRLRPRRRADRFDTLHDMRKRCGRREIGFISFFFAKFKLFGGFYGQ